MSYRKYAVYILFSFTILCFECLAIVFPILSVVLFHIFFSIHNIMNKQTLNKKLHSIVWNSNLSDNKKNRMNNITAKYLLSLKTDNCPYCRCVMDYNNQGHTRRPNQVTLQRQNNNLGHLIGNVHFCCFDCNVVKRIENKLIVLERFEKDKTYSYEEIRDILLR